MFRMNGMPRAQGCAGAACVSFAQRRIGLLQDSLDTLVVPGRLRVAHPCAQSRSTVHPEHNTLGSVRKLQVCGFEKNEHSHGRSWGGY